MAHTTNTRCGRLCWLLLGLIASSTPALAQLTLEIEEPNKQWRALDRVSLVLRGKQVRQELGIDDVEFNGRKISVREINREDGKISFFLTIPVNAKPGTYTVVVSYDGRKAGARKTRSGVEDVSPPSPPPVGQQPPAIPEPPPPLESQPPATPEPRLPVEPQPPEPGLAPVVDPGPRTGGLTTPSGGEDPEESAIEVVDASLDPSDPDSRVDLGRTPVGTSLTTAITIRNRGPTLLNLGEPAVPLGFLVVGPFPTVIAVNESVSFAVGLEAGSAALFAGNLQFSHDGRGPRPFVLPLVGVVVESATPVNLWRWVLVALTVTIVVVVGSFAIRRLVTTQPPRLLFDPSADRGLQRTESTEPLKLDLELRLRPRVDSGRQELRGALTLIERKP